MHPADLERELARLVRLAEASRGKLDDVDGAIESLRKSISDVRGAGETTPAQHLAQAKVVSK